MHTQTIDSLNASLCARELLAELGKLWASLMADQAGPVTLALAQRVAALHDDLQAVVEVAACGGLYDPLLV